MTIDVNEVLDLSIVKIVIVYYELKKIKITVVGMMIVQYIKCSGAKKFSLKLTMLALLLMEK